MRGLQWKAVKEGRVWHLPVEFLDDRRLHAFHQELHGIADALVRDVEYKDVAEAFRGRMPYLCVRHDEAALELLRRIDRNQNSVASHTSNFVKYNKVPGDTLIPTDAVVAEDVSLLRSRWEAEGYFFGVGYKDLCELEHKLGLPLGRDIAATAVQRNNTRKFVHQNRVALGRASGPLAKRLESVGWRP